MSYRDEATTETKQLLGMYSAAFPRERTAVLEARAEKVVDSALGAAEELLILEKICDVYSASESDRRWQRMREENRYIPAPEESEECQAMHRLRWDVAGKLRDHLLVVGR